MGRVLVEWFVCLVGPFRFLIFCRCVKFILSDGVTYLVFGLYVACGLNCSCLLWLMRFVANYFAVGRQSLLQRLLTICKSAWR